MKKIIHSQTLLGIFGGILGAIAMFAIFLTISSVIAAPTVSPPDGNPSFPLIGLEGSAGTDGATGPTGPKGDKGDPGTSIAPSRTFIVGGSTTAWRCTGPIDIRAECADADGCRIRLIINNISASSDEVRIIDENIYMESQYGTNAANGLYGWTRQGGGGDHSWITGNGGLYTVFSPWGIGHAFTYKHSYCTGLAHAPLQNGQISFLTRPGWYVIYQIYD